MCLLAPESVNHYSPTAPSSSSAEPSPFNWRTIPGLLLTKRKTSYGSGLDAGPRKAPGHMECCPARTSGTFGLWKEQMDLPQPNSRTNCDLREIYVFIIWGKAFLSLQTSFSKQYFGFDFKTVFLSWEDYTNRVVFFHQRILILIKEKKREVLRVVIQLLNKGCGIKDSDLYHFFLTWCFPFLFS